VHPHYHRACSMVGQPVYVNAHGRTHYGVLHHVTTDGIHLHQNRVGMASGISEVGLENTPFLSDQDADIEPAFWPFLFLPWLAIAGLGYYGGGWGW